MNKEDFYKLFYVKGNLQDTKKMIEKSANNNVSLKEIQCRLNDLIEFIDARIDKEFQIQEMTTYDEFREEELIAPFNNSTIMQQLNNDLIQIINGNGRNRTITYGDLNELCDVEGNLLF